MKTKIELDVKSLIIGAAAASVLLFSTGAASAPGGPVGRYQIAVGGDGRAAIVDTMTGQAYTSQISASETIGTNTFLRPK